MTWLTVNETIECLNVSRQHIYTLARRYQWRSKKSGAMRYFNEADVMATPDADERQRRGYENRQSSTRVEN